MQLIPEQNLLGELYTLKAMNIKPNFSALQRKYGYDRHTIKNTMMIMALFIRKGNQK